MVVHVIIITYLVPFSFLFFILICTLYTVQASSRLDDILRTQIKIFTTQCISYPVFQDKGAGGGGVICYCLSQMPTVSTKCKNELLNCSFAMFESFIYKKLKDKHYMLGEKIHCGKCYFFQFRPGCKLQNPSDRNGITPNGNGRNINTLLKNSQKKKKLTFLNLEKLSSLSFHILKKSTVSLIMNIKYVLQLTPSRYFL